MIRGCSAISMKQRGVEFFRSFDAPIGQALPSTAPPPRRRRARRGRGRRRARPSRPSPRPRLRLRVPRRQRGSIPEQGGLVENRQWCALLRHPPQRTAEPACDRGRVSDTGAAADGADGQTTRTCPSARLPASSCRKSTKYSSFQHPFILPERQGARQRQDEGSEHVGPGARW